jgi:hypothetical protein
LIAYLLEMPVDLRKPEYLLAHLVRDHCRVLRERAFGREAELGEDQLVPLHVVPIETFDKVRWPTICPATVATLLQAREALIKPFAKQVSSSPSATSIVSDRTVDTEILREVFRQHLGERGGPYTFQADGTVASSSMSPVVSHIRLRLLCKAFNLGGRKPFETSVGLVDALDVLTFTPAGFRLEEGSATSFALELPADPTMIRSSSGRMI